MAGYCRFALRDLRSRLLQLRGSFGQCGLAGFALIVVPASCEPSADKGVRSKPLVRDSASVMLVENVAFSWTHSEQWLVSPEPLLTLGVVDGPEPYQLSQVRAAVITSSSGVVVLDGSSRQLRKFDSRGKHVWTIGRRGGGPGEFEQPVYIGLFEDDSFGIWDRREARLTVVTPQGRIARTRSFAHLLPVPVSHGLFDDDTLLVTLPHAMTAPAAGTLFLDTLRFAALAKDTEIMTPLVRLEGPMWLWTGRHQLPVPFTINPPRVVANGLLFVAEGAGPALNVYGSDGFLKARFRAPVTPDAVRPQAMDSVIHVWAEQRLFGATLADWHYWVQHMPIPALRPVFDKLLADDFGHIWARRFHSPSRGSAPEGWFVFRPDGVLLGKVTVPAAFELHAVRGDRLAGVMRDDLDVEYVYVYGLDRRSD